MRAFDCVQFINFIMHYRDISNDEITRILDKLY